MKMNFGYGAFQDVKKISKVKLSYKENELSMLNSDLNFADPEL